MTLDLDELERVASAATPGPWEISSWHPSDPDGYAEIHADEPEGQVVRLPLAAPNAVRNATHIAVFNPVTVLALLARARDAERLGLGLKEVTKAAYIHMATHPVFRAKAVGDEGSHARRQQLDQIETENALMAAVKEWRDQ